MRSHLALLTLACLATAPTAGAATFAVASTEDAPDAAPGDGRCETGSLVCTLRAAIEEANARAGDDIITIAAGTYPAPATGLGFVVSSNVTLEGAGAITTVLEGGTYAVLVVQAGAMVRARGLTVANGRGGGGGVRNQGTLDLTDCTVRHNAAGGIVNSGTLTLTRTLVTQNFWGDPAGGLTNNAGATATVVDSVISHNAGTLYGGVFNRSGGTATITGSAVIGNLGDGVGNAGTLVMTNSTVSGNHVGTSGVTCTFAEASMELADVTIADNLSVSSTSGVGIFGGCAITMRNSLVAGNREGGRTERNCAGTLTSQGHNLIRMAPGTPCVLAGDTTGDITDRDPLLGPLADNGGPTPTHALLAGSPALDAGDPAVCPATDQRGVARPQGDRCDIGAYEAGGPPPPPPPPPTRFVVDDTGVAPDAYPGDGACRTAANTCTLTAAMLEAQALPGAATIELGAATYTLDRVDHTHTGLFEVALPNVTSDLTIVGQGAGLTRIERVPAGARNVVPFTFNVQGGPLTLRRVTIAGAGRAPGGFEAIFAVLEPVTVEDSEFTASYQARSILIEDARLTLRRTAFREAAADPAFSSGPTVVEVIRGGFDLDECTFENNTALLAIDAHAAAGEPHTVTRSIFRNNRVLAPVVSANVVEVSDSLFEGNVNTSLGSGAAALGGAGTITRCTFRGNQTGGFGGAITVSDTSITDSAFVGNTAAFDGGAISGSSVSITNSTFSGNAASGNGGAIHLTAGPLRLRNVTIVGNRAVEGRGGGIWLPSLDPLLADVADMKHVLLAGNSDANGEAPDCHAPRDPTTTGPEAPKDLRSLGFNLVGDTTGCRFLPATGDQIGTAAAPLDPGVADLADNGGPTPTRALLPDSLAVDAGDPAGCTDAAGSPLSTDQRGFARPADGDLDGSARCDIGAFELGAVPIETTSTTTSTTLPPAAERCGNCVDDDGNALTDFEDPACCGGASPSGLILKRLRIRPKTGKHVLKMTGSLTAGGAVDPLAEDVFLQLRQSDGEVLCARLPAATFVRRKKPYVFTDKLLTVPTAQGIAKAVIAPKRNGSAKLVVKGKQVALGGPRAGSSRLTVGFQRTGAGPGRCAAIEAGLQGTKKGALRFP